MGSECNDIIEDPIHVIDSPIFDEFEDGEDIDLPIINAYQENDSHDISIIDVYHNSIVDECMAKSEDTIAQHKHPMKSLISWQSTMKISQSTMNVH